MLKRLEFFLIVLVFIFITVIILIIYSKQREQEFISQMNVSQKTSIQNAAFAIDQQLKLKQRHASLFAYEYAHLINLLYNFPRDTKIEDDIEEKLKKRFPDFLAFTITNHLGTPKIFKLDSLVGQVCQADLQKFAENINNKKSTRNTIFIHPQPFNYHYDIMTPMYANNINPRIFFVSFHLDEIVSILKTYQLSGQNLMLVRKSKKQLIEVNSHGARDKLEREIELNKMELKQIKFHKDIPNSDWRLINLTNPDYLNKYQKDLFQEATFILLIVIVILILFLLIVLRISKNRPFKTTP